MSDNFLYFNYVRPESLYYEKAENNNDSKKYIIDLPTDDWTISEFTNWKFYANKKSKMQDQGWKIHISTTLEEAQDILNKVSRVLFKKNIAFKHIACEGFLQLMNSKHGNRASAGKFMAIYPNENEFPLLLDELYECLRGTNKGPYILSDECWKDSNVYYRYGGFKTMLTESGQMAIRNNEGKLIPDNRTPYYRIPDFVTEPEMLKKAKSAVNSGQKNPTKLSNYKILNALRFNNGGGIYLAEEKKTGNMVVIKEARPRVGFDGNNHDAKHRLENEYFILKKLSNVRGVVKIKDYFNVWENNFLVEEFVEGIDLTHWVSATYPFHEKQDIRAYSDKVKVLINNIINIVHNMHQYGIGMGDLQPSNIMVGDKLNLTFIDFESAQELYSEEGPAMMTVGFAHKDNKNHMERDWYGVKRILQYCILPIGPVDTLGESVKESQKNWIIKNYGEEFYSYVKRIESECDSYLGKTKEKEYSSIRRKNSLDINEIVQQLRNGIQLDDSRQERLIKGDIRQYEMEYGNENVLVGGFGGILALYRSGNLDSNIFKWVEKFKEKKYSNIDFGLLTGISGIASVLFEIDYKEKALKLFDEMAGYSNTSDITFRSGLAGIALSYAFLYEKTKVIKYLETTIDMADKILAYIENGGEIRIKDWAAIPIGLIDGWSGISLLFSKLYQLTGEQKWKDFAVELIKKDLEKTQISKKQEILQSLDDRMRLLPYLSGGSLGIAVAIWFLNLQSSKKYFKNELHMILNLSKLRCTFSAGLFEGMGSLLLIPSMMEEGTEYINTQEQLLNKLYLYLIHEENEKGLLCPGNFSYRLSEDVYSGSAGLILALKSIQIKNPMYWMPLIGVESLG